MNFHTWVVSAFVLWGVALSGCSLTRPQPAVHHYTLTVTIPTAAAIANAIYNATGIRVTKTPINPLTLSQRLAGRRKEG